MTAQDILKELKGMGSESYKKLLMTNHGVREPCYGVKIGDMKTITRRVKKDHQLALELYDSGVYDAMYLAGLIADSAKMTKKDLQRWVANAQGGALAGSTVPAAAAGSPHGTELALKWIDSPKAHVATAGWTTMAMLVAHSSPPAEPLLHHLLAWAQKEIHTAPDPVRYAMNNFVIALGAYIHDPEERALKAAEQIGRLQINMGNNSCKVPFAPEYIRKARERGSLEKKRKKVAA